MLGGACFETFGTKLWVWGAGFGGQLLSVGLMGHGGLGSRDDLLGLLAY